MDKIIWYEILVAGIDGNIITIKYYNDDNFLNHTRKEVEEGIIEDYFGGEGWKGP